MGNYTQGRWCRKINKKDQVARDKGEGDEKCRLSEKKKSVSNQLSTKWIL